MIWLIIVGIVGFILFRFLKDLNKDNQDLQGQTLDKKFSVIVDSINDVAFNGNGKVTSMDKRIFNLYQKGQNQIINFEYSTGHLTITWRYKYFHQEVVHKKRFSNVRNINKKQQQKAADIIINEMKEKIEEHKMNIINRKA